jgi:small-conductance mechanosensitive channel
MAALDDTLHVHTNELQFVLHVTADFFTETLPGIGYLLAVGTVALLLVFIILFLWRSIFRLCLGPSYTQLSQYFVALPLLWTAFNITFLSVGINFNSMYLGNTIVGAALIMSAGDYTKDFLSGMQLLYLRVLDRHDVVEIRGVGVRGRLLSVGFFVSEFLREDEKSVSGFANKTVFVANRLILASAFDVDWADEHQRPTTTTTSKPTTAPVPPASSSRFDTLLPPTMSEDRRELFMRHLGGDTSLSSSFRRRSPTRV